MELQLAGYNKTNTIAISNFNEDEVKQIQAISSSIDLDDDKAIMAIGGEVTRAISGLNKTVLSSVKIKDIPEIESILPELKEAFAEVDSSSLLAKKPGFFAKIFRADPVKNFVAKFENAEMVVNNIQSNLQRVEMELRKDIELEDQLGQQNIMYIRDLEKYILGMRMKMDEALQDLETMTAQTDKSDYVALQLLEEEKDKIDGLDKQILWLEQQRLLAIQTLPILRNLKNNNKDMIRQISMTLQQSIPAWEQSIIIAFHIHRQQGALRIERAVHDMTNQLVVQNSQLLKENSVEIVKAVQSGMIDMETFREANKNLIETSKQVTEAKNLAMRNRQASIEEYRKLTTELLEAEKREVIALAGASVQKLEAPNG